MSNIYLVDFHCNWAICHGPPSDNCEKCKEASIALHNVQENIKVLFERANLELRHAYAWPDGSLYKYVKANNEEEIRQVMKDSDINISLSLVDPEETIYSGRLVSELFK